VPIWLSDFQRNQSEVLIIPPNFPNLILKNYNKVIAKNIVSAESETYIQIVVALRIVITVTLSALRDGIYM